MAGADDVVNRTLPALVGVYVVSRTADRVLGNGGKQRPVVRASRAASATYQVSQASQVSAKKAQTGKSNSKHATNKGRVYLMTSRRRAGSPAKVKVYRVTAKKATTRRRKASNPYVVIDKVPTII
ncbi:MAG: hypothetical protein M0R06_11100 [Sphaerochaeta sp.]|jgi:hypothetical protein|nr:hypothetical protein [Sphaerochaeta sp.]